jgi:hypothetical protein
MLAALLFLAAVSEVPDHRGPLIDCSTLGTSQRWVSVRNHRRALAFIEELRKTVELTEGVPFDCGLEIIARCGPDLDGDGLPEVIVRVSWEQRYVDGDDSESQAVARCHARVFSGAGTSSYSSLFVILSRQTTPRRDFVELLADETGSGREGPTRVEDTSWKGRPALKLHLQFEYSDTGETEIWKRIVIVKAGKLRVAEEQRPQRLRSHGDGGL